MSLRKKFVFKVNNQIVLEDTRELYPNQVDEMKWFVAKECSCHYDDVNVETVETSVALSEIDVDKFGLFDWKSLDCNYLTGLKLSLVEGSDEHLDAVANGTLENFIVFI